MIPLVFNKSIYFYLVFILMIPATSAYSNESISTHKNKILKVGVRAIKGVAAAKKTWTETINYLNKNVKDYRFELTPIAGFNDMKNAVKNKEVDFVITNPLAYIQLNKQSGITRLLTLNKKQPNGVASTTFAAVIFTRSDRKDILTLYDLKDKSIMGVHEEAFGGWRMGLRELLHHDIDPDTDSSKVLFSHNNTHEAVVYSVIAGDIDVGTVRTGVIEQLAQQGKIKLDSITILNRHYDNLQALHSTQHYPEWPFAVLPHIESTISNEVFRALLSITPTSSAAIAGNYVSWVAPFEYSEVYKLTDELAQHNVTLAIIWDKHKISILLFLIFVLSIIFYTFYLFTINKKLSFSELQLSLHRDHLEDIVRQRTAELTIATATADKANKAKSQFLSNMSHELRTPLNSILGFGELIQLDSENTLISSNADEILKAGQYLLSLINEILDLAVIESGNTALNLEIVSCSDILNLSLDIIAPLANKKNISIVVNNVSECLVKADRKRLQQIYINLLSNAVKYNKQDGSINIVLEKNSQNQCTLSVKDMGIGIKPEFHEKVFQPFVRDKSNPDVIEGTGVGLVITKNLVEQMHGEIGFNSEFGNGTEFWVTLPVTKT